MPNIDAFSAQIVKLVREMPDEAILDLVKHQLGALKISRSGRAAAPYTLRATALRVTARPSRLTVSPKGG